VGAGPGGRGGGARWPWEGGAFKGGGLAFDGPFGGGFKKNGNPPISVLPGPGGGIFPGGAISGGRGDRAATFFSRGHWGGVVWGFGGNKKTFRKGPGGGFVAAFGDRGGGDG